MSDAENKITIEFKLEGAVRDAGLVRFADFATFVDGTLATLKALEREATQARHARIEYRITNLEIGSALLALEAIDVQEYRATEEFVATRLAEGLATVRDGLGDFAAFDAGVRASFVKMLSPLRRGVRSITANVGETRITITGHPGEKLLEFVEVGDESVAVGSFSGSVDALNVHGDHFFYLYPPAGPTKIKCVFDPAMLDDVRGVVKRYTTVYGLVEFVDPNPFPHRIIVDRLEPHPDPAELPTLSSLWGAFPHLTGGLDAAEFVQRGRDAQ